MKIKPKYKRIFKQLFNISGKCEPLYNLKSVYYLNGYFYATDSYTIVKISFLEGLNIKCTDGSPIEIDTFYECDMFVDYEKDQFIGLYQSEHTKRMRLGVFDDMFKQFDESDDDVYMNPKLLASALKVFEIAKINPKIINNKLQVEMLGSSKEMEIHTLTMGLRI